MSDPLIDILFFAVLAAFIVFRLRSVLGKRTGNEKPGDLFRSGPAGEESEESNVIPLASRRAAASDETAEAEIEEDAGVRDIRSRDPNFTPADFLDGARYAFEIIVEAFARGDKEALEPLLSKDVMANFAQAIDIRADRGEVLTTTLVDFRSVTLHEAVLRGQTAFVTVRFVTSQINALRDSDGKIVDGDVAEIEEITDLWTFARNVRSDNPNWLLVSTDSETPEEEEQDSNEESED